MWRTSNINSKSDGPYLSQNLKTLFQLKLFHQSLLLSVDPQQFQRKLYVGYGKMNNVIPAFQGTPQSQFGYYHSDKITGSFQLFDEGDSKFRT